MELKALEPLEGVEVVFVQEVDPQSRICQRRHDPSEPVLERDVPGVRQREAVSASSNGRSVPPPAISGRACPVTISDALG
jgi:hypothetical protein